MRRGTFGRFGRMTLVAGLLGCAVAGCRGGAVAAAIPKKIVDLSPTITDDLMLRQLGHRACDFLGVKERLQFTPIVPSNDQHTWGLTELAIPSNIGAHLDAPARLLKNGERPHQIALDKLFGPAKLIELAWKDRHSQLQVTDLETYASSINPGDIVILYVDYRAPQDDDWPTYAALSPQAAQWLVSKKIKALATDMPSIGGFNRYADLMEKNRPVEEVWAERLAFSQAGIPVIEGLANVGQIVGEKNIVFAGFPLPVDDRGGAPVRAVAILYP